ncbi:hypothetical protein D3C78_1404670 [compost metagenome]
MQVDVAAEGVHIAQAVASGLAAAQPEDAGEYPVAPGECLVQFRRPDLAGPAPAAQYRSAGQPGADLRADLVQAARGAAGTVAFTRSVGRGGNAHAQYQMLSGKAVKHLIRKGNMQEIEGIHGRLA